MVGCGGSWRRIKSRLTSLGSLGVAESRSSHGMRADERCVGEDRSRRGISVNGAWTRWLELRVLLLGRGRLRHVVALRILSEVGGTCFAKRISPRL